MTLQLPASAVAVLLTAATALLVGPATPAAAAGCDVATQVGVVVDFASLGGGVDTGCTVGDPTTGVEALQSAGFPPSRAQQERSGYFLCRISGKPASDPCQRAASSSAYWSYWHAAPGGAWSFSNTGPGSYDPAPGTVEGWAFGAGKPPSAAAPIFAAAPAAAPDPAPASPTLPRVAPASPRPASPAPAVPAPARPPVQQSAAVAPATSAPAQPGETSPAPAPSTDASTGSAAVQARTSAPATAPAPDLEPDLDTDRAAADRSTSPAGPLAAAALVVALLLAGGWQLARRRRESASGP